MGVKLQSFTSSFFFVDLSIHQPVGLYFLRHSKTTSANRRLFSGVFDLRGNLGTGKAKLLRALAKKNGTSLSPNGHREMVLSLEVAVLKLRREFVWRSIDQLEQSGNIKCIIRTRHLLQQLLYPHLMNVIHFPTSASIRHLAAFGRLPANFLRPG